MKREQWKSKFGFIWAAVGSAVGLGSIWRFPYVVGENGGATFVLLYLICLALVGFPVLIAEIFLGRKAQQNPYGAYRRAGNHPIWGGIGVSTVITGFLVSTFYGVIAGWTLGYFFQALFGVLTHITTPELAYTHFHQFTSSSFWPILSLFGLMLLCGFILYTGVQKGIEAGNKVMMPLLILILFVLVLRGIALPNGLEGFRFLFKPEISKITPRTVIMALGQAFFALSLGQGTMVTYGSYLRKHESLTNTCIPIAIFGTMIALLAGMAIFPVVFSVGLAPTAGESLMFQTLPIIFSTMKGGYFFCLLFFLLLLLAGITSQISALEPTIAFLVDQKKWSRKKAVLCTVGFSFLVATPLALSNGVLKDVSFFGYTFLSGLMYFCVNILIPLGGLSAVILAGWKVGIDHTMKEVQVGSELLMKKQSPLWYYLRYGIKYIAPLIIVMIMCDQFGLIRFH